MKRLFSLSLFLMTTMLSFAHDFESGGIYYNITSSTAPYTVAVTYQGTSYSEYSNEYTGSVTIPDKVTYNGKTYSVTAIGSRAFYGCSGLTSITIPNSVTAIGSWAFSECTGLTSIIIPNSVTTIGSFAFEGCSGLTSITIPNSVTAIGSWAFHSCSGLTSVTIPNSVTAIGDSAFYGCSSLTSVTIGNSVTSIGSGAFFGCSGLTSVTIGNSVTSIGENAFDRCSGLTSVTIPNSVTSIGDYAFRNCSGLTEIVSLASIPPVCNAGVFENVDKSLCTLKVPKGSKDAYSQTDGWKDFVDNIEEVDVTGIEAVTAEGVSNADITDIYDLNGRRRDALQPGVNIVKMSDGTTRKVIKR